MIRTPDPLLPKQVRYQAALYSDNHRSLLPVLVTGTGKAPPGGCELARYSYRLAGVQALEGFIASLRQSV